MYTGDQMKKIIFLVLISLLLTATACDTELGHLDEEDHDHDGDGIPDHAAEDHDDEAHTENMELVMPDKIS